MAEFSADAIAVASAMRDAIVAADSTKYERGPIENFLIDGKVDLRELAIVAIEKCYELHPWSMGAIDNDE